MCMRASSALNARAPRKMHRVHRVSIPREDKVEFEMT